MKNNTIDSEQKSKTTQKSATDNNIHQTNNIKRVKLLVSVVILLCILFLTVTGLYIYEKNKKEIVVQKQVIVQENKSDSGNELSDQKVSYTAKVGKFRIDLNDQYAIILRLDGSFEGGPATQLQVGEPLAGVKNSINLPSLGEITINAVPASNYSNNFDSFLASSFNEQLSNPIDSNLVFDGVEADAYRIDGLVTTDFFVFANQGIYYSVIIDNPDRENYQQILNDIASGFTFVE
ncbi:MAG: hypothetical protein MUF85_03005 [Patescibacteria group bacterium]|jgi:hypothetical protein|nr:hypothetical protein [Patescibacteria group bacterium]